MTATFIALDRLAALDAEIRQLEHSRTSLPARVELASLDQRRDELALLQSSLDRERAPLRSALEELEREVEALATRRAAIEQRLATATGASRDLAAMDGERRHLAQLQEGLEERELELMEQLEPLDAKESEIDAVAAPLVARRAELLDLLAVEEAGLDAELRDRHDRREEAVSLVGPPLLERYHKISARSGGVGAARLVAGRCGACHLQLATVELDQINRLPLDEIAHCEQCGRLLIRPAQLED